jgi:hypothetical protein
MAVAAIGSAVPVVASPRGRESGLGAFWRGDGPAEAEVQAALEDGDRCACTTTRGTCAEIGARDLRGDPSRGGEPVDLRAGKGVPTTNNTAERAERHAVIWRRIGGEPTAPEGAGSWGGC